MAVKAFAFAALMSIPSLALAEKPENYCLDKETNARWASMLSHQPNDQDIAKLFALRIGLCELVARKIVSLEQATNIFEKERVEVIRLKEKERKREKNSIFGG